MLVGLLLGTPVGALAQTPATESAYRRVDNWAQLPPGYAWGTMSAVAIDAQGNVYGFQRDDPTSRVIVFDKNGKYLKIWGELLYVAAPAPENRVTVGTTAGKVVRVIEGLDAPHGIAVDAEGAIYVAQSGGKAIVKFVKQ